MDETATRVGGGGGSGERSIDGDVQRGGGKKQRTTRGNKSALAGMGVRGARERTRKQGSYR